MKVKVSKRATTVAEREARSAKSKALGAQIKAIIKSKGLKINYVAQELSYNSIYFTLLLNGQRNINDDVKGKVEKFLDVKL